MTYCVGVTGDIASGKTTVSEFFFKLGIDVIRADTLAKELTQKEQAAYKAIVAHYGLEVLNDDGELNRTQLREIIFSNVEERTWLEQLLHPLIRHELKKRVDASTTSYCIVEIPLLITKEVYPYIKNILLVKSPKKIQLSRIMARDQCSKEQALAILATQPDLETRLRHADEVIDNDSGLDALEKKVRLLHHTYLRKSS